MELVIAACKRHGRIGKAHPNRTGLPKASARQPTPSIADWLKTPVSIGMLSDSWPARVVLTAE